MEILMWTFITLTAILGCGVVVLYFIMFNKEFGDL